MAMQAVIRLAVVVACLALAPAAASGDFRLSDGALGSGKQELVAQIRHSNQVVAFFTVGHKWMTFPRHQSCNRLGLRAQILCLHARNALQGHLWLRNLAGRRLMVARQQETTAAIVARLQQGLAGRPLYSWSEELERAGREWNVSPYLMAAIAGTESTFGQAIPNPGNAWGLGCDGVHPCIYFGDFGAGVRFLAQTLATNYPISGGNLTAVGSIYAACGSCWASATGSFMQSNFGASPYSLLYPHKV